jgi:hypothetical protein
MKATLMMIDRRSARALFSNAVPAGDERDVLIDQMQDYLDDWLVYRASHVITRGDVAALACDAEVVRTHRPLIIEVLSAEDVDGLHERGFHTDDGSYIGLEAPQIACSAHQDLVAWPCPAIQSLVTSIDGPSTG